ncbi:MAG TPA: ATP-binding protein [Solirubrobacteraceae bacterium]
MNGSPRSPQRPEGAPPGDDARGADLTPVGDWPASAAGSAMRFQDSYPAQPDSVSAIRKALQAFTRRCRLPRETADAVALAVSEAATNVVVHAYRDSEEPGRIEVAAAVAADELWVIITDKGLGMRPRTDSPGLGLGLAIIAQMADGVDLVKPADGGLELRMRFAVPPASDR